MTNEGLSMYLAEEKFKVQVLGVDNIRVDRKIQSRVAINVDYMHEFTEAMLAGAKFPPVAVFWDGRVYWLADGFHRHGAAKRAGIKDIRSEIHTGARRDAVIYSAGANKAFSIPRTTADKNKAIEMLLADDEWFTRSAAQIAAHVGVSGPHVRKVRLEWCQAHNLEIPAETLGADGRTFPITRNVHRDERAIFKQGGSYRFVVDKKEYNAGPDLAKAKRQLTEVLKERGKVRRSLTLNSVMQFLVSNQIANSNVGNSPGGLGRAIKTKTAIIVSAILSDPHSVLVAAAQAFFNRAKHQPRGRAIVVCYDPPQCEALEVAKSLGVEFLTPDEAIASLKRG